uniref:Rho termination factor N-terminal domain-containing protein n=1 Tax=viral metagenome TaxID=1070528 RepID=A0A6C0ASQ3_9ZZZZ
MGLFSFIETFFFISLGITFVLILLLVYHFKQRLSTLEQKCDTMFEIINNVVQEITIVRGATARIMQGLPSLPLSNSIVLQQSVLPEDEKDDEEEEDEEEEEEDEKDEDEDDDEDDEDEDEDDDDDDDKDDDEDDDVVTLETIEHQFENVEKQFETVEHQFDIQEEVPLVIESSESDLIADLEIVEENINDIIEQIELENPEKIQEEPNNETTDYKNMNLQALKTLVVAKGLVTNANKLKKNELLKLLDESV